MNEVAEKAKLGSVSIAIANQQRLYRKKFNLGYFALTKSTTIYNLRKNEYRKIE